MSHVPAATLLAILLMAPLTWARAQAGAELCAIIEATPDTQGCRVRLLNPAAAGELPSIVAGACRAGTQLTVELPSSGLYQQVVTSLCQSSPVRASPKMFTCYVRLTSQGRGNNRHNSGVALEHNPMLDRHAAPGA